MSARDAERRLEADLSFAFNHCCVQTCALCSALFFSISFFWLAPNHGSKESKCKQ